MSRHRDTEPGDIQIPVQYKHYLHPCEVTFLELQSSSPDLEKGDFRPITKGRKDNFDLFLKNLLHMQLNAKLLFPFSFVLGEALKICCLHRNRC
jgi:hypothetical protein